VSLFIDIDALCKLAHWRLSAELPKYCGVDWADCATLQSVAFRAKKSSTQPDGRLFRSVEAAHEVLRVTSLMSARLAPNIDHLSILQDLSGVDAGESILFASIAASNDHRLLTGDKRAIRAIAALPETLRFPYHNKVIIIEQVLTAVLSDIGVERLREYICPWLDIDIAVRNVMGSQCNASASSVREGLDSYVKEMTDLCVPSLISDF
jgi:hypothetical protein